jgi:hypothetical protein
VGRLPQSDKVARCRKRARTLAVGFSLRSAARRIVVVSAWDDRPLPSPPTTRMGSAAQNRGMKETERDRTSPRLEGGNSWADETLPLGLRRELLARELRQAAATRPRPESSGSSSGLTGRKVEGRARDCPR